MGAFEYTALDAGGRERKGILEGDTPRHIRQLLREQQLLPVSVTEVAQKEARRQRSFSFARRVSPTALSLFTRQLATLARAGLPLEEALLAVSQQTEKPRVQSIVLGVRARVMEGHTLADGFAEFPRVFPEIYRATVAAGEQAGHLDDVLERLADYTESREQIRQKVLSASSGPVLGAWGIAGEVVRTLRMRDAVADAAARVREGAPIGRSLGLSRMFPPMTIHLISSGESSGQLENMLERAAISQERELDGLLSALVGLLGPLLIIVMGLFVMGIVFAMLLPIFQMNQLIH